MIYFNYTLTYLLSMYDVDLGAGSSEELERTQSADAEPVFQYTGLLPTPGETLDTLVVRNPSFEDATVRLVAGEKTLIMSRVVARQSVTLGVSLGVADVEYLEFQSDASVTVCGGGQYVQLAQGYQPTPITPPATQPQPDCTCTLEQLMGGSFAADCEHHRDTPAPYIGRKGLGIPRATAECGDLNQFTRAEVNAACADANDISYADGEVQYEYYRDAYGNSCYRPQSKP
jgi:hypothetical protein